jgi:hypothetical protein
MRFLAVHDSARRADAGTVGAVGAAALSAAACALALAGCGIVSATSGTTPAASPPSRTAAPSSTVTATPSGPAAADACTTAQLKVAITHSGALAGQAGGYLTFTNDGTAACQMNGWPAVVAVTAAGKATALKHAQSTMYGAWRVPSPLPVVTLRPGASAYAVVAADDQPAGSATSCASPFVRLRVSPPGSSASVAVSAWLPGAATYLPSCTTVSGAASGEVSAITSLSSLPH